MANSGHENSAFVQEEYVEREGAVYRRVRFDGEEWGEWEITFWDHLPWVLIKLQEMKM